MGLASSLPFIKPDISSDAESREEQDGTKYFVVRPVTAVWHAVSNKIKNLIMRRDSTRLISGMFN